ncbi:hypothetical protein L227DRAFT_654353 [Lentinus tigrinus ALCF2SS1-6]|uniref:Uncharacterized protein n=2 Tax=Lentinus tigrinus TaxID=5365 RepID=A0A5C2S5C9_9APHY|nr:hypothetical protein L227DRAFT_654353 [Lentinus tigrinus ALCF2SS1-6]
MGSLLLTCVAGDYMESVDFALECYDICLDDDTPAIPGAEPPYDMIISESWQPIPHFQEWSPDGLGAVEVSQVVRDVVVCSVLHWDRPLGDYDETAGNYNEQLNPRFPLPGFEQIYLVHLAGPTGRWLHPRYVEPFIGARAYIHQDHLYLLGRTACTYVVRDYRFSTDMLLSPTCDPDTDFFDLGCPLAECESGRLPDPRVPWGSWDHEDVHFDPLHGFTILLLRDWFGEGQLVRLPLPRPVDEPTPRSTVHAFTAPIIPNNSKFTRRWLGLNHAIIYGEEELGPDSGGDFLFRLSFQFDSEEPEPGLTADGSADNDGALRPLIIREDLQADVELPLMHFSDPFAFDEGSVRMCMTERGAVDQAELFVFSLGHGP